MRLEPARARRLRSRTANINTNAGAPKIERERCSVYYGMGNMARALLEHENHPGHRLGAMRTGLTIGPPEDIRMTIEALGAEELCNVYGSTETYGNCAVTDARDPLELRLHCQGLPLPGMRLRHQNGSQLSQQDIAGNEQLRRDRVWASPR